VTAANGELMLQTRQAVNEALTEGRLAPSHLTDATDHAVSKTHQHQPAGWSLGLTPQVGAAVWAVALLLSSEVGRRLGTVRRTQKRGGRR
jgi:hypothetical protein